jgi:hypothetical protein
MALSALRSLIGWCNVLGVLRTAADPAGDPVCTYAAERGIAARALENPGELHAVIARFRPEAVVISSFNRICRRIS